MWSHRVVLVSLKSAAILPSSYFIAFVLLTLFMDAMYLVYVLVDEVRERERDLFS